MFGKRRLSVEDLTEDMKDEDFKKFVKKLRENRELEESKPREIARRGADAETMRLMFNR